MRDVPESIFSAHGCDKIQETRGIPEDKAVEILRSTFEILPPAYVSTTNAIMRHLQRVPPPPPPFPSPKSLILTIPPSFFKMPFYIFLL